MNYKLIHSVGNLQSQTTTADEMFGITQDNLIAVSRKVECYSWKEGDGEEADKLEWREEYINSHEFQYKDNVEKNGGHNPTIEHWPAQSKISYNMVNMGVYTLPVCLLE